MSNCSLYLSVSVPVSDAYVKVLSVVVFFIVNHLPKCTLIKSAAEVLFCRHTQQVNSPLVTRMQHRCKMATKLEESIFQAKI